MNKKLTKALSIGALASTLFVSGCSLFTNKEESPVWLDGIISPTSDQGKDGDFYLDTKEQKIYKKENGVWVLKSFVGQREIEKIELVETGVEYDVYKITYTNGEAETFNSYRNNASEEAIKDAYIRAYSNTLLLKQWTFEGYGIEGGSGQIKVTYDNENCYVYYESEEDKEITSYIKDEDLDEYVVYVDNQEDGQSEFYSQIGLLGTSNPDPEEMLEALFEETMINSLSVMKWMIKDEVASALEIEEDEVVVDLKAEIKDGKNHITITGIGNNGEDEETQSIELVFGSYIEKVIYSYSTKTEHYTETGEQVFFIKDTFDETLQITDFSQYPDPVIATFTNLKNASIDKAKKGYKVTRTVEGLDITSYIETGDYTQHHRYYDSEEEVHEIYTGTWKEYHKDEEGKSSVTDLNNTSDELMRFETLSIFEEELGEYIEKIEYSQVDGELVIEITVKTTREDESENKKFLATFLITYETNGNMSYFDKITGTLYMVEVDENGELVEDGLTSEGSVIEVFQYSMDEALIEDFNPSDYTNND